MTMNQKDIVIITSILDTVRQQKLKDAHIDNGAVYHLMTRYEAVTKARGMSVIGVVLDATTWEELSDDLKKTLTFAATTCLMDRGLKNVKELVTYVS